MYRLVDSLARTTARSSVHRVLPSSRSRSRRFGIAAVLAAALFSGCGSDDAETGDTEPRAASSAELRKQLRGATSSRASDFPAVRGRTLQQVADGVGATGPQFAAAGSVYTPGRNRVAFGVIDPKTGFVYGPTALYVARSSDSPATGPYPAPADLLVTDPPFRSKQAATEDDPFAAIYSAQVPMPKAGAVSVLAVTKVGEDLVASPGALTVVSARDDPVVRVGERAPRTPTDTADETADISEIDTRVPPDDMHDADFADVVGRKPVALLFATPQLCQSRVCGPVVDIALQLRERYGNRIEFIHQEVYVDNQVDGGLREPLKRFGVPTEPWLFVVGADGRVTARLEGSFGFNAVEQALRSAL